MLILILIPPLALVEWKCGTRNISSPTLKGTVGRAHIGPFLDERKAHWILATESQPGPPWLPQVLI